MKKSKANKEEEEMELLSLKENKTKAHSLRRCTAVNCWCNASEAQM